MPRSRLSNWASRQRLSYIADHLHDKGWINREALSEYFGTERSLGSMDISEYQRQNGPLRKANAGDVMKDGTVAVGYKLGGRLLYTGEAEASGRRWNLLPHGIIGNHADWLRAVMTAWRQDHPLATIEEVISYFGIGKREAEDLLLVQAGGGSDERRGIWEDFR